MKMAQLNSTTNSNMPWAQKTKRAVTKWARSVKRAKKPSLQQQAMRQHSYVRLASSNYGAANTLPISLATDSLTGRPKFSNTVNTGENLALQFRLDQVDVYLNGSFSSSFAVPNYTEFTSLYDEYCIKRVDVFVLPSWSNANVSSLVTSWLPWIVHAVDYDDTSSTSAPSLMQYPDAQFTQLLGSQGRVNTAPLRVIKPRAKAQVMTSAGGSGVFHPRGDMWIVTSNPTCPHLGFKMSLDDYYGGGTTSTNTGGLNIICKYYISCRDVV